MKKTSGIMRPIAIALAALTSLLCGHAVADTYPSKPIKLIVPSAAGGITDVAARVVARKLSVELGQPIVVENRAGGGGRIGATDVARAPADGYTLLYANSISNVLLPATSKSVQYDSIKDFAPIAQLFWYSTVIVCNPSAPFNTVKEFADYARKNPGKVTMGTAGLGSGNHFSSELFNSMAGVETLSVPYKGNAPAIQDVLAGTITCTHVSEAKSFVDSGKLKALATTGLLRDPRFPNLTTVDEAGLKGYDVTWWQGIVAPAATPPDVIAKLVQAAKTVAKDPAIATQTADIGLNPMYGGPAEFTQRVKSDMVKFQRIAAQAKIVLD